MSLSVAFVHMPESESLTGFIEERFGTLLRKANSHHRDCDVSVRVEGTAKSAGARTIEFKVAASFKKLMGHSVFVCARSTDARDAVLRAIHALEKRVQKVGRFAGHSRGHLNRFRKKIWASGDNSLEFTTTATANSRLPDEASVAAETAEPT